MFVGTMQRSKVQYQTSLPQCWFGCFPGAIQFGNIPTSHIAYKLEAKSVYAVMNVIVEGGRMSESRAALGLSLCYALVMRFGVGNEYMRHWKVVGFSSGHAGSSKSDSATRRLKSGGFSFC